LRRSSPLETIGGGVVVDPLPPRRSKPWPRDLPVRERLKRIVEEAGAAGAPVSRLPQRLGVRRADIDGLASSLRSDVTRIGGGLWAASAIDDLSKLIKKLVADHHRQKPLEKGAPVNELRARARVPEPLFDHVLNELAESKKLVNDGGVIRQPGFSAGLSSAEERIAKATIAELTAAGAEPPTVAELAERHGPQVASVMRFLERTKAVVQVEPGRYYTTESLQSTLDRLASLMNEPREYTPAELREALGTSRKFLIPLLEYCDRQGLTIRSETGRRWRSR
jgi:selenocysteine-specific elongation factor